MLLLALLSYVAPKESLFLEVAHVNYHLRGKASQSDERLVQSTAQKFGLPYHVLQVRVRGTQNLEETSPGATLCVF